MWKVGGIKIESAAGRQKKNASGDGISCKREIFCKSLRTRKFSMGNLFGVNAHGILTHSGFRKCIWFGWQSLRSEVLAAQIHRVTKNQRCQEQRHSANFRLRGLQLIEHGLQYLGILYVHSLTRHIFLKLCFGSGTISWNIVLCNLCD